MSKRPKGLSPRVRGNPEGVKYCIGGTGPIPACAGQPANDLLNWLEHGAYPRVCGATQIRAGSLQKQSGLSPRVRGNRFWVGLPFIAEGPIPACAGQPACWLVITA